MGRSEMGIVNRTNGQLDIWNYDKQKRVDKEGVRWHFAVHQSWLSGTMMDGPYEILFRDQDWKEVGIVQFERLKDNPYKYDKLFEKLMSDPSFRSEHLAPETRKLWNKNWK